ncbi:MAG: hypothetical protein R3B90_01360 [Planctomycetaceae bacterium]
MLAWESGKEVPLQWTRGQTRKGDVWEGGRDCRANREAGSRRISHRIAAMSGDQWG